MPTRPLADFLPLVLPHAAGVPIPVAEQYLRLSAIEWCERTRCWRHIETTNLVTATDGAIVAPDYATIHEIETAYFDGVELEPTQFSKFTPEDLDTTLNIGVPQYITQVKPGVVSVIPFAEGALKLTMFLKPRSGTEYGTDPQNPLQDKYNVVPEHLFTQSAEQIAEGALARLLLIKNQEWSDPKLALYYRQRFDWAMDHSFATGIKGQQRAAPRAKPQFL